MERRANPFGQPVADIAGKAELRPATVEHGMADTARISDRVIRICLAIMDRAAKACGNKPARNISLPFKPGINLAGGVGIARYRCPDQRARCAKYGQKFR